MSRHSSSSSEIWIRYGSRQRYEESWGIDDDPFLFRRRWENRGADGSGMGGKRSKRKTEVLDFGDGKGLMPNGVSMTLCTH